MLRNNADARRTFRFCNLRKWKDFNKKQLTSLKMCVTSLLCGPRADLWPFYGFLCKRFSLYIKVYLNSFIFVGYRNDRFFPRTNPYILNVTQQRRCSYFELGLPVVSSETYRNCEWWLFSIWQINITIVQMIWPSCVTRNWRASLIFFCVQTCGVVSEHTARMCTR